LPIDKIKHVVVLMMENRSFDHLLGLLRSEIPDVRGVVGNDYFNQTTAGATMPVTDGALYQGQYIIDPGHDFTDVYMQMYGVPYGTPATQPNMSGFAQSYEQQGGNPADIMRCFQPSQLPALAALARQYVICDQWFSSVPGPTLPNRAFAHFGTSFGRLDMSPDYFRSKPSIYQRITKASKRGMIYYYATWSGTLGLTFLLSDQKRYFGLWGDFQRACGNNSLPEYSFVEPAYSDHSGTDANDQHPDHSVQAGDSFLQAVYEAIRSNDQTWQSTVLLVVWDEHGGIFDHEIPPMVGHLDGFTSTAPPFDFDRLGVRVPALVISPYVAAGLVDHTVYEHASIPATVTEQFIGPPLTFSPYAREQYANTFLHLLTLDQPRMERPDFSPAIPAAVAPGSAASSPPLQVKSQADAPASSLQSNQVQEVYGILSRNHPQQARDLHPSSVKTEQDAAQFVGKAMAVIHPEALQTEGKETS
jgi:phospholipase C